MDVNRYWMCDAGRQSYSTLYERPRFDRPILRGGPGARGPEQDTSSLDTGSLWDLALDRSAELLRGAAERHGRKGLAAIVSARLTIEDLYVAKRVLGDLLGVPRLAVPPHEAGEDDHLLLRRDKTPNARGAAAVGIGTPSAGRVKEILEDAAAGNVRGLVVVGEDLTGLPGFSEALLEKLDVLVVIDWWQSPAAERAHVALPACGYGEFEGTMVNFQGRVQRLRAGLNPRGEADPVWRILRDLGRRFGLPSEYATSRAVFDDLAAKVPAFAGLSYRALGDRGAPLPAAAARDAGASPPGA